MMIGQVFGTILEKQPPQLVVNVNGLGYEIDAPMSTFYQLPDVG
jgi:Holliday junction DNA helicase RuvA